MADGFTTYQYGTEESQCVDLYRPDSAKTCKGLICLIHGGYWRYPHSKEQMNAIANSLRDDGYYVWNIEYRRVRERDGGWPNTFEDVVAAVNFISQLSLPIPLNVQIVGHSAGGHLALWLGYQQKFLKVRLDRIYALAPVVDLVASHRAQLGEDAVGQLLKTTPEQDLSRYQSFSPIDLLPNNVPQIVIHGDSDEYVDVAETHKYMEKARNLKCDVRYTEIRQGMHLDFLDPHTQSTLSLFNFLKEA
ncbi:alpha/beta hydrolase [Vibrio sp.]|uniref:Alpha/beta hydrolase n=1 Tax=Vibrio viridaestus TaxID=2487322 RepID=A0A3N9THJ4_9VIBR|nr:alpha/beta hydrolase [Vibrio viridaestus]MDC0612473.1 alpha/beta hydrolase [Vibrio sp.]RQW63500.1 alpha/beta hydrolase [Vibrio viridaestus]